MMKNSKVYTFLTLYDCFVLVCCFFVFVCVILIGSLPINSGYCQQRSLQPIVDHEKIEMEGDKLKVITKDGDCYEYIMEEGIFIKYKACDSEEWIEIVD